MSASLHCFRHDAMESPFELMVHCDDENYARSASVEIFREVDRLEQLLSKFVENSDVARIAALSPGETTVIMNDTMQCLLSALWVYKETSGAFDVSIGQGLENLSLDTENMRVGVKEALELDLGGIGKGFALDAASLILEHWELKNALITAGPSTVLALGMNGDKEWSIGVHGTAVNIKEMALSASGKDVQGEHIINPVTKEKADGSEKAWVICPSAAVADALSTAFIVMDKEEVKAFCEYHSDVRAYLMAKDNSIISYI